MSIDFLRRADWLTAARVRRAGLVALVVFAAMLAWDVHTHTERGVLDAKGEYVARDFVNYWTVARLAAKGEVARSYDTDYFVAVQRRLFGADAEFKIAGYPPVTPLLALPLAALDFGPALALWLVGGIALCAWLLSRTLGWPMALLAGLASPAVFINAVSGQNGQFSAALMAGGVLALGNRPALAGLCFGLLCFKPQLGLLLPFVLAAGGYWRAFASAAATVAVLVASSAALFGIEAWAAFLEQASLQTVLMQEGSTFWHRMPTVFTALRATGAGLTAAYATQAVSALLAIVTAAMVWRSACAIEIKGAALVIGTFLVSAYAWDYDLVVLTFAVAWLAADAVRTGFLAWERIVLAALIVMPMTIGGLTAAAGVPVGPVVLWLALLYTARRALAFHAGPRQSTLPAAGG